MRRPGISLIRPEDRPSIMIMDEKATLQGVWGGGGGGGGTGMIRSAAPSQSCMTDRDGLTIRPLTVNFTIICDF